MSNKVLQFWVGVFILAGIVGLLWLAVGVSGVNLAVGSKDYTLTAEFDNIGGLKVRAPVRVSGVSIGKVTAIDLDPDTFRAKVFMTIDDQYNQLPIDTSASIYTEGILGANYVAFIPGFQAQILKPNGVIASTTSALVLENLVGQLMYSLKGDNKSSGSSK